MHSRRARPTLRVLQDDLQSGWESSHAQPRPGAGGLDPLSPLSDRHHPIIRKAAESFGDDPTRDNYVGRVRSSTRFVMLEIKSGQWRGGVWVDPDTGVCWLVAAGLAKGDHTDRDDFYERVKRADESGEIDRWLPTDDDRRQLKRETAARLMIDWELDIQGRVLEALRTISGGGTTAFVLPHPTDPARQFGECTVTMAQADDPDFKREEVVVEIDLAREFRASNLGWQATLRVLIAISPPETGWDRVGDTYSTIGEIGSSHFASTNSRRSPTAARSRSHIRTTGRTTLIAAISPTAQSWVSASAPYAASSSSRTRITNPCRSAQTAKSATWRCRSNRRIYR